MVSLGVSSIFGFLAWAPIMLNGDKLPLKQLGGDTRGKKLSFILTSGGIIGFSEETEGEVLYQPGTGAG
jgi:hypothetical protein